MVCPSHANEGKRTNIPEGQERLLTLPSHLKVAHPCTSSETQPHGDALIGKKLDSYGLSSSARDIIMASWRQGTTKQYTTYLTKWNTVLHQQGTRYV